MSSVLVTGKSSSGSSRWSPTPEQVLMLEGMYRGGLKTPSATQIQQITTRLSIYGEIQGKNVFYWFQNHKARDRQKIRKKLMALYQQQRLYPAQENKPFLPLQYQVGGVEDTSSCRMNIINNWKQVDFPSDQTCKLMCECGVMSMMMMDNHGATPYCTRVPPKTLQLFPLTSTTADDHKGDDHSSKS